MLRLTSVFGGGDKQRLGGMDAFGRNYYQRNFAFALFARAEKRPVGNSFAFVETVDSAERKRLFAGFATRRSTVPIGPPEEQTRGGREAGNASREQTANAATSNRRITFIIARARFRMPKPPRGSRKLTGMRGGLKPAAG
jgi:hypothetical protein